MCIQTNVTCQEPEKHSKGFEQRWTSCSCGQRGERSGDFMCTTQSHRRCMPCLIRYHSSHFGSSVRWSLSADNAHGGQTVTAVTDVASSFGHSLHRDRIILHIHSLRAHSVSEANTAGIGSQLPGSTPPYKSMPKPMSCAVKLSRGQLDSFPKLARSQPDAPCLPSESSVQCRHSSTSEVLRHNTCHAQSLQL
jgi:hypothetical protein